MTRGKCSSLEFFTLSIIGVCTGTATLVADHQMAVFGANAKCRQGLNLDIAQMLKNGEGTRNWAQLQFLSSLEHNNCSWLVPLAALTNSKRAVEAMAQLILHTTWQSLPSSKGSTYSIAKEVGVAAVLSSCSRWYNVSAW